MSRPALLALAALLASCAAELRKPRGAACDLSSDCDTPLVCRLQRCRIECATSRDCTQRTQCLTDEAGLGACQLPDETRCALDSECTPPLVCGQGRCLNQCASDRDCLGGAQCLSAAGGPDEPCAGDSCVCRERAQVGCLFDGDCRSGDDPRYWLACIGGTCRPECVTDRDCRTFDCRPLAPELLASLGTEGGYCGPESECERWYVARGATGDGIGGWAAASGDLAQTLEAAASRADCQEVWVAEGTYVTPDAAGFTLRSGVRLHGGFAGDELTLAGRHGGATVLSGDVAGDDPGSRADNARHVLDVPPGASDVLVEGLTVRGGQATGSGADGAGGGVRVGAGASVTLRGLTLTDNEAAGGGGLSVLGGARAQVVDCVFDGNRAPSQGGGGADHVGGSARYEGCTFRGNSGNGAGALNAISGAEVELLRCALEGNTAATLGGAMRAGAAGEPARVTVVSSSFRANVAPTGGAIHAAHPDTALSLTNVVFWGNEATETGAALSVANGSLATVAVTTAAGNRVTNAGGAVALRTGGRLSMTSSVLWGNTSSAADPTVAQLDGDASGVSYCAVEGLATGEGNVAAGATFTDLAGGADADLAPGVGSTTRGAGNAALLPADIFDLDGDMDDGEALPLDRLGASRLRDGELDMGAVQGS